FASGKAPQELLEDLHRLAALDEVPAVDDDRRHGIDAVIAIEPFASANLRRVFVRFEDLTGPARVKSDAGGQIEQHCRVARVPPLEEICFKQGVLERALPAFRAGPLQQPVSIESVVDPGALVEVECESDLRAARAKRLLSVPHLLRRGTVLGAQMLDDVLALLAHLRIELEGLKVEVRLDARPKLRERGFERAERDRAPGAGDIGDEVDLHTGRHGAALYAARAFFT